MITMFQTTGASAGDRELVVGLQDAGDHARQPEQQHDREHDLGQRARRATRRSSCPLNSGRITPASRMPESGDRAEHDQHDPEHRRGEAERLPLRPCCSRSVKTGTNAAESAAWANRFVIRFGICEATVKRRRRQPRSRSRQSAIDLADQPDDARSSRGAAKIAVFYGDAAALAVIGGGQGPL